MSERLEEEGLFGVQWNEDGSVTVYSQWHIDVDGELCGMVTYPAESRIPALFRGLLGPRLSATIEDVMSVTRVSFNAHNVVYPILDIVPGVASADLRDRPR